MSAGSGTVLTLQQNSFEYIYINFSYLPRNRTHAKYMDN